MSDSEKKNNHEYVFCKEYVNRWGKRMVAADYGYQFWRLKVKRQPQIKLTMR